jgi:acyl carrier protein
VLGGLGLTSYAAANTFMDNFAALQSCGGGQRWLSMNWDGWLRGADQKLTETFQTSMDEYAMSPHESVEALERVLSIASASGQVVVSTGDLSARLALWITRATGKAANGDAAGAVPEPHARPNLVTTYVEPANEIEEKIVDVWQELLGIDRVGVCDNFFEMGGNSLIGLKIMTRLRKELNMNLPVTALFEAPTVQTFAKLISREEAESPDYQDSRARGEGRRQRLARRQLAQAASGQ